MSAEYFQKRNQMRSQSNDPSPRNNSRPSSAKVDEPIVPTINEIKIEPKFTEVKEIKEVQKQSDSSNNTKKKLLTNKHLETLQNDLHKKIKEHIDGIHVKLGDLLKHDDLSSHKEEINKTTSNLSNKIEELHSRISAIEGMISDD